MPIRKNPRPTLGKISNLWQLKSDLGEHEIFTQVTGYQNYYISSYGRVYKRKSITKTGRVSKAQMLTIRIREKKTRALPYQRVNLFNGTDYDTFLVHRLVAMHFCPNPSSYDIVNHIDFDYNNNHYSNLEWCTTTHNNRKQSTNVITERIAQEIRVLYVMSDMSQAAIARAYSVSETTVRSILTNERWYNNQWCGTQRRFI